MKEKILLYMIILSSTKKMDGIKSWSLNAGETCPGSRDPITKKINPVCEGCYAKSNRYSFKKVIETRSENKKGWKHDNWVDEFVKKIKNEKYFRWFDSGDAYCISLIKKIKEIIEKTPNTKHWLPTKSFNLPILKKYLDEIKELPNVCVRYSSPSIDGYWDKNIHGSTCIPLEKIDLLKNDPDVFICTAGKHTGIYKCNGCKACWDKNIKCIAYIAHGRRIKKLLNNINLPNSQIR